MMADNPGIKAFCYINWDWSMYPQWKDWGDSRLQVNKTVGNNFAAVLKDPLFFHGTSEETVRTALGLSDGDVKDLPAPVLSGNSDTVAGVTLVWTWPGKPDALLRYEILRNGTVVYTTTGNRWNDTALKAGEKYSYTIRAVGKSGRVSPLSGPFTITAPPILNKIRGGNFETESGFFLRVFEGGEASFKEAGQNGSGIGEVTLTKTTGTNWHIQLNHPLRVEPDMIYNFSGEISAEKECTIQIFWQKAEAPYKVYLVREEKIGPVPRRIVIKDFSVPVGDDIFLAFMMGSLPVTVVRFDNIVVEERLP